MLRTIDAESIFLMNWLVRMESRATIRGVYFARLLSQDLPRSVPLGSLRKKNDTSGGSSMQNGARFPAAPNIDIYSWVCRWAWEYGSYVCRGHDANRSTGSKPIPHSRWFLWVLLHYSFLFRKYVAEVWKDAHKSESVFINVRKTIKENVIKIISLVISCSGYKG